jgi:hypothetical protein
MGNVCEDGLRADDLLSAALRRYGPKSPNTGSLQGENVDG